MGSFPSKPSPALLPAHPRQRSKRDLTVAEKYAHTEPRAHTDDVSHSAKRRRVLPRQNSRASRPVKSVLVPSLPHLPESGKEDESLRQVPSGRSVGTKARHVPPSPSAPRRPRTPPREADVDIRGSNPRDAPVKKEHVLRAVRAADGTLSLDVGGVPLYSPGFFAALEKRARVVEPRAEGEDDAKRCARLDGPAGEQFNFLGFDLRKDLRKRTVRFERSAAVLQRGWNFEEDGPAADAELMVGALGLAEKRRVDMREKLYLAPLTTVGNLPYRRVCKRLGADITCGEMAVAANLLQGHNSEWALLRRHVEEDVFGVQLAGSNVDTLTRAAELVSRECRVDFVELNVGCPIDVVFNKGGGCALMKRRPKLRRMVWSMGAVLDVPLGVKVRTGVSETARNAHEVIGDVGAAGAAWVTVHGRSRKQRYSKEADWAYITDACVPAARKAGVALLGNGDVYHWRDAARYFQGGEESEAGVESVMVARGALIKPWVFTEIRERRDWDISSTERLELYREFARNGLAHWGADDRGVETTRRFLLEWLSFLYRYVPVGLVERGGGVVRMCDRAPFFRGRDELETLLGSHRSTDWIRITEMLLGKAPPGFQFRPRHKSNAWGEGAVTLESEG